jgi:hypothetical protein
LIKNTGREALVGLYDNGVYPRQPMPARFIKHLLFGPFDVELQ